jgi:hypothetical protein
MSDFTLGRWRSSLILAGTFVFGALGMLAIGVWQFGSIAHAIGAIQGYSVLPIRAMIPAGEIEAGRKVSVAFELRNLTGFPVSVVGAQADCGCIAHDDLPLAIEPKSLSVLHVSFTPGISDVGHVVSHAVTLHLSVDGPPVVLRLEGTVVEPSSLQSRRAEPMVAHPASG